MNKIVFATNNSNKLDELRQILNSKYNVLGLSDIGYNEDIPETGTTLKANASIKSKTIYDKFGIDCFSDDTGLEVDALSGNPGVYSARYAGENSTYEENVEKLLIDLNGKPNRNAAFSTVISLFVGGKEYFFEGRISGKITTERSGKEGFGYDPVFMPDGYDITFAQMPSALKNRISHRALATAKLISFLENL